MWTTIGAADTLLPPAPGGTDSPRRPAGIFPPNGAGDRAIDRALAVFDYGFAAYVILISTSSFVFLGLHGYLWILAYALFAALLALCYRQVLAFWARNLSITLYALLALCSVLWSDIPRDTLHFASLLLITTGIALFIAMRLSLSAFFFLTSGTYLFLMVMSFLNIHNALSNAYNDMGRFTGIFLSKNAIAHGAIEFSVAAIFIIAILPGIRLPVRAAFLAGLALTVYMAPLMGSATAILLIIAYPTVSLLLAFLLYVRSGPVLIVMPVCIGLTALILAMLLGGLDPITPLLGMLGKDATLTGRTVLWDMGREAYLARPVLGFGIDGFWGNPVYQPQIQVMRRLYGDTVFGFHNLFVELMVALGPLGVVAHLAIGVTGLARALRWLRRDRDPLALWALVMVVCLYTQAMVSPQLYRPNSISYITLLVIVAALGKEVDRPRRKRRGPWGGSKPGRAVCSCRCGGAGQGSQPQEDTPRLQ